MIAGLFVGAIVHYWNPSYPDDANYGVGQGPYPAIVTKIYDPYVSLSVFTHGKTAVFHCAHVPCRGSPQDDGVYPAFEWPAR
jgi:hypothetical protein